MSDALKRFLNEQANRRLARLGYSDGMIRDAKREAWWWLLARREALVRRRGLLAGEAVVWTDAGRAELVPIEVAVAGPGEVTIAVETSFISPGTERAQYLRLPSARVSYPHRPGYSAAGTVLRVGNGSGGLRVGDRVAAVGAPHASIATVSAKRVYRIPDGVGTDAAALVQIGVICGQGVRRAEIQRGETVCLLGLGLIGALAQRIATAAGAGGVTALVRSRQKESVAKAGGVERLIALEDGGDLSTLAFPVVIEATGDPEAVVTAARVAAAEARVVLLGSPRGLTNDFPLGLIREKRLTVIGAHVETLTHESELMGIDAHAREAEDFLGKLAAGTLPVSDLIGLTVDPREADAFYRDLARNRELVGARFDWTRLPDRERVGGTRLWRLPDVSGRGMDAERKPLRIDRRRVGASDGREVPDPFAGASGELRVGLLGCGDIAVHNAAALAATPNASLAACFDPEASLAEDLARAHGVEAVRSMEALLDRSDVDAVFLAVPHHLHAPLAIQAAEAGKHVIVEKPLANDLESAVAMVRAAERAGVVLSVCFPHRYEVNAQLARRLVAAGALGSFAGMLISFYSDKPASYWLGGFSGRSVSSWRTSRAQAGGGVLIMNISHLVDLVRYLAGEEAEECFAHTQIVDGPAEVEDGISLTIRYTNGAVGTLFASSALRGQRGGGARLDLWGSQGFVTVEPELRVYTLRAIDGLRTARWQSFEATNANIRAVYLSRLATAIDRGEEPDVSAADGLAVQAFIEAAYRSSELSAPVRPAELLQAAGA
ncbi:MAG: Gfo/Idh/MocA family oxidoreductase [Gaiellaceae bacterium]